MIGRLTVVALALCALFAFPVYGQKSTEIFIPIGKSPGLSGEYSVIGTIDSFDPVSRVLTIRNESGQHLARVTDDTKIWLDKSGAKKTNVQGSSDDCRKDRLCEIKYVYDGETRTPDAAWIKIRVHE